MSKPILINSNKNKTRKQLVEDLYISNPNMPKKELWNKAVEELYAQGMQIDIATARTYVWCAEQKLARKINPNAIIKSRNIDNSKLKRSKAYELFETNSNLNRKQMINLIESKLGITRNSAETHCSLCAKKFSTNNPSKSHGAIV